MGNAPDSNASSTDHPLFKPGNRVLFEQKPAQVLDTRQAQLGSSANDVADLELYLHFIGFDPRLDRWVAAQDCTLDATSLQLAVEPINKRKRKRRSPSPLPANGQANQPTVPRRISQVRLQSWEVKCWYDSPYDIEPEYSQMLASHPVEALVRPQKQSKKSIAANGTLNFTPSSIQNVAYTVTSDESANAAHESPSGDQPGTSVRPTRNASALIRAQREASLPVANSSGMQRTTSNQSQQAQRTLPEVTLYVCQNCFNWTLDVQTFVFHDVYCQNLALFGKFFIDHKYVFFDTEDFYFYVMTENTPSQSNVLGFFSKEKQSPDNYNLACIVVFPPYQGQSWGAMMIEMSYELSKKQTPNHPGTPERPLSDLGLRSYIHYWLGVISRFLRDRLAQTLEQESLSISIEEIAKHCHLRIDDVALALEQSLMAKRRQKDEEGLVEDQLTVTTAYLREVADTWKVKRRIIMDDYLKI